MPHPTVNHIILSLTRWTIGLCWLRSGCWTRERLQVSLAVTMETAQHRGEAAGTGSPHLEVRRPVQASVLVPQSDTHLSPLPTDSGGAQVLSGASRTSQEESQTILLAGSESKAPVVIMSRFIYPYLALFYLALFFRYPSK